MQHPSTKAQADVLAYAAKVTRPTSRLGLWEQQIFELLALGVSFRQVQAFLAQRGTVVDVSAIHRFVHAKKRAGLLAQVQTRQAQGQLQVQPRPAPAALAPSPKVKASAAPKMTRQKPAAAAAPARAPAAPPAPGSLPKFTWDPDRYDIEDLK
ncbi:hypothetical protein ACS5PK_22450 [Roseateles sp. DB2]|uniref:hypothetical protein n=1 Tax=Roseateles sp. DB2 TaxID=3453717 RepID=UPI003EEF839C